MPSSVTRLSPGLLPHTYNSSEGSPEALMPGIILKTLNTELSEYPGILIAAAVLKNTPLEDESSSSILGACDFDVITISFNDTDRSIDSVSSLLLVITLPALSSCFFTTVSFLAEMICAPASFFNKSGLPAIRKPIAFCGELNVLFRVTRYFDNTLLSKETSTFSLLTTELRGSSTAATLTF